MMERLTLSQRFAGINLVDTDDEYDTDDDIVAMRHKYLLQSNNDLSYKSVSEWSKLTSTVQNDSKSDEALLMQSGWKNHFLRLTQKCSTLNSGIFNCLLYGGLHGNDEILPDNGVRCDHEEIDSVYADIFNDRKETLDDKTTVSEFRSSPEQIVKISGTVNDVANGGSKVTSKCDKQVIENNNAKIELAFKAENSQTKDIDSDKGSVYESVEKEKADVGQSSDKTGEGISKTSHKNLDNNKKGSSVDNISKSKPAVKKKEQKVVKKFDIKRASSFPLDELLPLSNKPSMAADIDKQTTDKIPEKPIAIEASNTGSEENSQENQYQSIEECFHGSVFDYDPPVDEPKPDITANNINTTSSFLESGLLPPDSSGFDMTSNVNNVTSDIRLQVPSENFVDNSYNQCIPTLISSYNRQVSRNVDRLGSRNVYNTGTTISEIASSNNITMERNQIIQSTLDEIGQCNSLEQCESLLQTLNEQCSALVTTDEDRVTLEAMIKSLRLKLLDASMYMDEANNVADNTPEDIIHENVVGPSGDSSTLVSKDMENFEGRTLLKGGVEPRHIPKTSVNKFYQERPRDPRLAVLDYCKKCQNRLPMPKFSVDLYGEKTVKKMIHLDWESYKGNSSMMKDPRRVCDQTSDDIEVDMEENSHETKPVDSMNCTLETGNIQISVQESFMGINSSTSGPEISMLMNLHDQNLLYKIMKDRDEMKTKAGSSDLRKGSQGINKQHKELLTKKKSPQATLKSESNIKDHFIDIESDDDWEEGQISTDSESRTNNHSASNISGNTTKRGNQINDRKRSISGTMVDHQKGTPPLDNVYKRERRSSVSSITSSTSRSSETQVQNKTKSMSSAKKPEYGSTQEKYHSQSKYDSDTIHKNKSSETYHRKTENEISIPSSRNIPSHKASPLSLEPTQPTVRRRHQTTHDGRVQVSVIQEPSHTMKRCHSLEEVGRKRHKSGDMLSDKKYNTPIYDQYSENNLTISDQYSKKTTSISDQYNERNMPISGQYNKKATPISDKYNKNNSSNIDQYNKTNTPTSNQYNSWNKQPSPFTQQMDHQISLETPMLQNNKPSVRNRLGWDNTILIPSNSMNVHDQLVSQNVHSQPSQSVPQYSYSPYNVLKVPHSQYVPKQSCNIRVQERLGQLNISEQSGNHTISLANNLVEERLKGNTSFYTKELSKIAKSQTKLEASDKYANKYEPIKSNMDSEDASKPSVKSSSTKVKRRKSLEEQQKEMEQDKQFLEQFKLKLTNKK
ncbi:hypothetical protein ACF0H5_001496 [Mactra antiquata]